MGAKTTYTCDSCESEIKFKNKYVEEYKDTEAATLAISVVLRGKTSGCSGSSTGCWDEESELLLCKNCRQKFISKIRSLFPKFFSGA